jgi:penicillin-binding protein 2
MDLRPFDRPPDRPRPRNRMALRIAVVGGFGIALFGLLFFRLWDLQVLDGSEYLAEAKNNRTREFRVIAPRGSILARDGEVLVDNRTSLALQLNPTKLSEDRAEERAELARIGQLAGMSLRKVRRTIAEGEEVAAGAPVTLRKDVDYDLAYYLRENQDRFPGVDVQRIFVRHYPHQSFAAHVLGGVNEIDEDQLKEPQYRDLEPGDKIGQGGVEETYDDYLRGQPGLTQIQVNAAGQPTPGGQLVQRPPIPGENLKLSLDPDVQAAGEAALGARGAGAFVTMNVNNGEILGLGSSPSFDPTEFTKPMTQAQVNATYNNEAAPLTNRATMGLYPTGSVFKIVTALAALEAGIVSPSETIFDNGSIMIGDQRFQNAGGESYGPVDLVNALRVSSDVYFYLLGLKMWDDGQLQRWASKLGIGQPSGIDLPEQTDGLVPSEEWRNQLYEEGETDRPWSAGDNVQLATGQGDLQTNPLQMAIAYAALGNGGAIVTPHVGLEIEDAAGRVLKEFEPKPQRHVKINPAYQAAIMEGLHDAAQVSGGTSYGLFGGFPIPVAGKTGTAQRDDQADQSWYVILAPYPNPRIVTAVTVEEGGFGAESAAPVALSILEAYFGKHASAIGGANGGSPG